MSNYVAVVPGWGGSDSPGTFREAIAAARDTLRLPLLGTLESAWARVATFDRLNGSGTPVARDPHTGSWLFAAGTWFSHDYASGDEARLLARYLDVGAEQLARELDGHWTLVIGDARTRELVVITDPIGTKIAYVRSLRGAVVISGSSRLLASLGPVSPDPVALQEFLATGIVYEDRTFFREVRKLDAATVHRFRAGAVKRTRWWSLADLALDTIDGSDAVEALSGVLAQAGRRIARRFPRPICDLTGGYDSRVLVAGLLGAGVPFTTTVTGTGDMADVRIAAAVAAVTGRPHRWIPPMPPRSFADLRTALWLTDGEYDLVEFSKINAVHRELCLRYDVSINGSSGEIARGRWWEHVTPGSGRTGALDAERMARARFAFGQGALALVPAQDRLDLVEHFTGVVSRTIAHVAHLPRTVQVNQIYLGMRMRSWQGRIASSSDRLWPVLSPFLFRSVVETMVRMTARVRRRSLVVRRMLWEKHRTLAVVPLDRGYAPVPFRPETVANFAPVVKRYGDRITRKLRKMAGADPATRENPLIPRLTLWRDPEIQQLLDPRTMRSVHALDGDAIARLVRDSRADGFASDDLWTRLLTLECAMRDLPIAVRSARTISEGERAPAP